ncbi:MAG: galactokinase [Planctomycetota bacterium]
MPAPQNARQLLDDFARRFGRPAAAVARAPGRVNLIGEHTDYNDGFVLPMALEQSTWAAAGPRSDDRLRVIADELHAEATWPVAGWTAGQHPDWTSYIAGVALLLRRRGAALSGCDVLIRSDVPVGSGLSSSAALEVSTAAALARIGGIALAGQALADLCRTAEHEFAHVPCGIMDQYVSVLGRAGQGFLLDCRTRTWDYIPFELGAQRVVIVNSGVRHKLAAGEYGLRQAQCRAAVDFFRGRDPAVRSLRDVTVAMLERHAAEMDPQVAARARHVVTENARTRAAVDALRAGRLSEFGALMYASHASLRDDYEVSCRELDLLVELVGGVPGVVGARLTGGGFGGCIVAIAPQAALSAVSAVLHEQYDGAGFGPAHMILSRPGAGASVEYGA